MANIVNLTATFSLGVKLNLAELHELVEDVVYYPKVFSGAKLRVIDPQNYSALIFSTGKIVLTGINSELKAKSAANDLLKRIIELYPNAVINNLAIHNYVLALSLKPLNLNNFYLDYPNFTSYEIELFPGLIHRCKKFNCTATMFHSGKINITGIKKFEFIEPIIKHFELLLAPYFK